jgi:hypothetical protein
MAPRPAQGGLRQARRQEISVASGSAAARPNPEQRAIDQGAPEPVPHQETARLEKGLADTVAKTPRRLRPE